LASGKAKLAGDAWNGNNNGRYVYRIEELGHREGDDEQGLAKVGELARRMVNASAVLFFVALLEVGHGVCLFGLSWWVGDVEATLSELAVVSGGQDASAVQAANNARTRGIACPD